MRPKAPKDCERPPLPSGSRVADDGTVGTEIAEVLRPSVGGVDGLKAAWEDGPGIGTGGGTEDGNVARLGDVCVVAGADLEADVKGGRAVTSTISSYCGNVG